MRYAAVAAVFVLAACQAQQQEQATTPPPGPAPGTPEWKMENAMSAAPASIAGQATLMEWGATMDAPPVQLRAGTNGWTCFANMPATPGNDPMCLDGVSVEWATAWMGHKTPNLKSVGFAYMLQGGSDASNTDPFAMEPKPGESWVDTGPHVMMMVPNVASLGSLSTDHTSGHPFIMFQGTPYAHVMMPVK